MLIFRGVGGWENGGETYSDVITVVGPFCYGFSQWEEGGPLFVAFFNYEVAVQGAQEEEGGQKEDFDCWDQG